jgi:hypothetical protein
MSYASKDLAADVYKIDCTARRILGAAKLPDAVCKLLLDQVCSQELMENLLGGIDVRESYEWVV